MTTYYVATTGLDTNDGLSVGSPFLSISKGASVVAAGDTITVADGNYKAAIYIHTSAGAAVANGTAANPITLKATNRLGAVIIIGDNSTDTSGNHAALEIRRDYWIVDGFLLDSSAGYAGADSTTWNSPGLEWFFGIYLTGSNNIAQYNTVKNLCRSVAATASGGGGISSEYFYGGNDNTIRYNKIYKIGDIAGNNKVHGIYIQSRANAYGNLVAKAASDCITSWHAADQLSIYNNTCVGAIEGSGILIGSGDAGAVAGGVTNSEVFNNICYDCDIGISEEGTIGSGNRFVNNCAFANSATAFTMLGTDTQSSAVTSSPLFVNYVDDGTGDYNLSAGSACINGGVASVSGVDAPTVDIAGTTRPVSATWDIGALEFGAGASTGDGLQGTSYNYRRRF